MQSSLLAIPDHSLGAPLARYRGGLTALGCRSVLQGCFQWASSGSQPQFTCLFFFFFCICTSPQSLQNNELCQVPHSPYNLPPLSLTASQFESISKDVAERLGRNFSWVIFQVPPMRVLGRGVGRKEKLLILFH